MLTIYEQPKKLDVKKELFAVLRFPEFSAQALWSMYPLLRKEPFVVVEQEEESHKTSILAVSPLARAMGVEAGMPLFIARRKSSLIVPWARDKAAEANLEGELSLLCQWYTPSFEIGYNSTTILNLTGTPLFRSHNMEDMGRLFQMDLKKHLSFFDVAVGISHSRLVAEVLSRLALPGRLNLCAADKEESTLASLPSSLLPRLSPKCRERLHLFGLKTIGQVQKLSRQHILSRFGPEGNKLYAMVHCISDTSEKDVSQSQSKKSIQVDVSIPKDSNDIKFLLEKLRQTVDKLGFELKQQNILAKSLKMELRYGDGKAVRRSVKLVKASNDFLTLLNVASEAFGNMYTRRVALKRISIAVPQRGEDEGQLSLFDSPWTRKQQQLGEAVTNIRIKNDFAVIGNAVDVGR